MPLEITTLVAFVHIAYNSSYNLRKSIFSLLKVYPQTHISSPCSVPVRKPLLVSTLKPLSPKDLSQTDNGLVIYIILYVICNNIFTCFYS